MGTVIVTNDPSSDFTAAMLAEFGQVDVDWDEQMGDLALTFENDLTDEQQQKVIYIVQHNGNERTLRDAALDAWQGNKVYLEQYAATATATQIRTQVERLTRQNNALIRLVMNRFDGTD